MIILRSIVVTIKRTGGGRRAFSTEVWNKENRRAVVVIAVETYSTGRKGAPLRVRAIRRRRRHRSIHKTRHVIYLHTISRNAQSGAAAEVYIIIIIIYYVIQNNITL